MESLNDREVAGFCIKAKVIYPIREGDEVEVKETKSSAQSKQGDLLGPMSPIPATDSANSVILRSHPALAEWEILEMLEDIGEISKIQMDHHLGGACVACPDEATASKAIAKSGTQFRGRMIRIEHLHHALKASSSEGVDAKEEGLLPTGFTSHIIDGLPRDMEITEVKEFLSGACPEIQDNILALERRGRYVNFISHCALYFSD
jgi:hypothetical protein